MSFNASTAVEWEQQAEPAALPGHRRTLLLLLLAYALSFTDRMILSLLFPAIKADFGLSDTQLGLLGGISFALFYATLGLPIARLSDQFNRKFIILCSVVVFSLMTALCGLATGFIMLLLLRIGVGVGEAGVNPASHSIIADYFPAKRRAFAMAILMLGANLGMMIGFVGGGFISEHYGWRIALMSVGLPGLVLAAIMARYLKEPVRGSFEEDQNTSTTPPPIHTSAAILFGMPAMRQLIAGSTITGMMGYGLAQWLPTFFVRTYDLPTSQVGLMMAGGFGILGAIGALVSGRLCDRLSARGFQYGVWLIAAVQLISAPFIFMALLVDQLALALGLFLIPAFTSNFYLGPTLALVQTLAPVSMRAVASAIKMLCLNLVGLGLGPLAIGLLSDHLAPRFGDFSLNLALAIFTVIGLWGALHFWLCGRALAAQPPTA
jgi:predicted MFS family arabinose efflux permease